MRHVLLFTFFVALTAAQRTTMRTCDCEYTVDGRCAYTLLLPAGGSDESTCPQSGDASQMTSEQEQRLEEVESSVASLTSNVTMLTSQTLENAQLLSQLQSRVMTLYDRADLVTSATSNMTQDGDTMTSDAQEQVARLDDRVMTLDREVSTIQGDVTTLQNDVTSAQQNVQDNTADVDRLRTNVTHLRDELRTAEAEVTRLRARVDELEASGAVCASRGLLVDTNPEEEPASGVIMVSSQFNSEHGPEKARIHYSGGGAGAWCPGEPNDNEWVQFDLGEERAVVGVVTKGRVDFTQWVTSYNVQYTTNDNATDFTMFTNVVGDVETFEGNFDQDTARTHLFWQPIRARFVRILPLTSFGNQCMRADLIGCLD